MANGSRLASLFGPPSAAKALGLRPYLKWAGGKRKLVSTLVPHFALDAGPRRLVEPFCGSGAVSLALHDRAARFWLNDTNADVIGLLERLRDDADGLLAATRALFVPENNLEARYYELRAEFNEAGEPLRRAALFLYLNRHGYNGLCRYNASGAFNVPFGRYAKAPGAPLEELEAARAFAAKTRLSSGDFRAVLAECGRGDTVYCDPPYVPLSKTASFTRYATTDFGPVDQRALVDAAIDAASRGAVVVISNHATEEARQLYAKASALEFAEVRRNISCDGENRAVVRELIAVFR